MVLETSRSDRQLARSLHSHLRSVQDMHPHGCKELLFVNSEQWAHASFAGNIAGVDSEMWSALTYKYAMYVHS
jgi:hypothetical protein